MTIGWAVERSHGILACPRVNLPLFPSLALRRAYMTMAVLHNFLGKQASNAASCSQSTITFTYQDVYEVDYTPNDPSGRVVVWYVCSHRGLFFWKSWGVGQCTTARTPLLRKLQNIHLEPAPVFAVHGN